MMTHFLDENRDSYALCGQKWVAGLVYGNDARATCVPCQDVWMDRTGWAFPLPEVVVLALTPAH